MLLALALSHVFGLIVQPPALPVCSATRRAAVVRMSEEMDWREMRARLVAAQKGWSDEDASGDASSDTSTASIDASASDGDTSSTASLDGGYMYESPLIEQGTILLGGTKMDFGFALRQQFFHKSVMLLLQHDASFTKGIILNRPSALELEGWRMWCGHGQVAEGGYFVGPENAMGELEINALHALSGALADELSTTVLPGVSYTSLEGAKALVAAGVAEKSDFWLCVGYSGWAPGQLQMEVEKRGSWWMASADSGTLLKELLRQARELPPPSAGTTTDDNGMDTWNTLMRGIGREEEIEQTDALADKMLGEWCRANLLPKPPRPTPTAAPPAVAPGTVLLTDVSAATGRIADRFLLREQYLHKALLLVVSEAGGVVSAVVLNRPTASIMKFKTVGGKTRRRFPYCGGAQLNGQLWLHHRSELGGDAIGESGLYALPQETVAKVLHEEAADASDFFLASAVVQFAPGELGGMLAAGEVRVLPPGDRPDDLWPRVWALTDENGDVSDGTGVWWLASQACAAAGTAAAPPSEVADEALDEWRKWFALEA